MKPSAMFKDKNISNRDKFGVWLRTTRKEHGWGVNEFASMLGISPAYLSDIEKGNRHAPLNHLEKITQLFNIPEPELPYLADLAGCAKGSWQDINDYLADNKPARDAMRAAKNANLDDEEFLEIFLQVLDDAQRKDFIDKLLYLVGDEEKDNCLAWISSKLSEKQIDAYIALSTSQEEPKQEQPE